MPNERLSSLSGRGQPFTAWIVTSLALVIGLCACASTPTQKSVSDWHDAVVAVQEQSTTTFREVNRLVRDAQLKRVANLQNLKESDFQPGLDAESLAAWNRAFDGLAAYSSAVSTLLGPELPAGVGKSTQQLGESIVASSHSNIFQERPKLASALGNLGAKVASLAAAHSAPEIMAQADPAVNSVLDQMARMIYDDSGGMQSGVYYTVHANWTTQADEVRTEFLSAGTLADKQRIAEQYAAVLAKRDAADAALRGLRSSLLELATTHRRTAAGGPMDTSALIASIREHTEFFKNLLADLKPATN